MGSFRKQQTPGKYMDGYLHENLGVMANKIVDDMTFLGVLFSSTLEVGTGKSVMAQEIGEAYTEMINEKHGLDIPFTVNNVVFRPKDLIEQAKKLPKYSCIILDEWEDSHYWSELGLALRQFFRKCRQLNLFMIVIIPNFFELTKGYAISRSVFAMDVKFAGEFERGFFDFYSFERKKTLYLKGKKDYNYNVTQPNFKGRFTDGYAVGEEAYRTKKYNDLVKYEEEQEKKSVAKTEKEIAIEMFNKAHKNTPGITQEEWGKMFGVSKRTINRWVSLAKGEISKDENEESDIPQEIIN